MDQVSFMEALGLAVVTAVSSGVVSYLVQERKLQRELESLRASYKTEYMAEEAARHFLSHKKFIDRSFEMLKESLGGWDDDEDELRKILVRAGAIRNIRKDGTEWWSLLERMDEKVVRWEAKKDQQKNPSS
ncbi:MAG: hypothetical protein ACFB10_23490 [Salibacteraceae bacterium]